MAATRLLVFSPSGLPVLTPLSFVGHAAWDTTAKLVYTELYSSTPQDQHPTLKITNPDSSEVPPIMTSEVKKTLKEMKNMPTLPQMPQA